MLSEIELHALHPVCVKRNRATRPSSCICRRNNEKVKNKSTTRRPTTAARTLSEKNWLWSKRCVKAFPRCLPQPKEAIRMTLQAKERVKVPERSENSSIDANHCKIVINTRVEVPEVSEKSLASVKISAK